MLGIFDQQISLTAMSSHTGWLDGGASTAPKSLLAALSDDYPGSLNEFESYDPTGRHFPSPSFIRPRFSRMRARDELVADDDFDARRTRSLPEARIPQRSSSLRRDRPSRPNSIDSRFGGRGGSDTAVVERPNLVVSSVAVKDSFASSIYRLVFPTPPNTMIQAPVNGSLAPNRRSRIPASRPASRPSTAMDPRSASGGSQSESRKNTAEWLNYGVLPTRSAFESRPNSSDKSQLETLVAQSADHPVRTQSVTKKQHLESKQQRILARKNSKAVRLDNIDTRLSCKTSHASPGLNSPGLTHTSGSSIGSFTLPELLPAPSFHEPDFFDFFDLSDDDIAEAVPPSIVDPDEFKPSFVEEPQARHVITLAPIMAPTTLESHEKRIKFRGTTLFTTPRPHLVPQPIRTHPAATAAALEVAQMASRFKFDLVYVLNLWPEPTHQLSTGYTQLHNILLQPQQQPFVPHPDCQPQRHMAGRLLAAYGLATCQSPFNISAAVHSKILQTDGWIEYRSLESEPAEFARGYACAFYQGSFDRDDSTMDGTGDFPNHEFSTSVSHASIDRGIVFAAYRKERAGGLSVASSMDELDELRHCAESLIDTLIDMDMAEQKRAMRGGPAYYDLTGPMPRRPHHMGY